MPRPAIADLVGGILDMEGIVVADRLVLDDALDRWRTIRPISFADNYHISLAKALGLSDVVSFDKGMSRDPSIRRIEP
jgi:predicted nucleic-acid-binding protein